MWRFLWRPRWVLSHLLVLALAVTMINLGLWQLRRLDERRELNALIEAKLDEAPAPIEQVEDPAADRFRRVTVEGSAGREIVVRNRSLEGAPGEWQVVEVELSNGRRVLVNRGFVPVGGADLEPYEGGEIEGYLLPRSRLDRTARIDLEDAFEHDRVVQALVMQSAPAPRQPIVRVPPPEPGDGPHLGYAVQWFIFSAIAIGGYPVILRRVARERQSEAAVDRELAQLIDAGG